MESPRLGKRFMYSESLQVKRHTSGVLSNIPWQLLAIFQVLLLAKQT